MKKLLSIFVLLMIVLIASCSNPDTKVEDNIKMYTNVWDEILNKGNLGMFDTHFASNYVNKTVNSTVNGPVEAKEFFGSFLTGFSDIDFVVDEIFGKDDRLVKRWTFNATHTGEFSGIPPTGKRITVKGVSVTRIVDGKIAEELDYMDDLGFLQQLGVIPSLDQ